MAEDNVIDIIIKAVAQELKKLFPKVKIYDEDIEQVYKEPCFFIIYENDDERKMLGRRYGMDLHFRLIYFQDLKEKDSNNKIYGIRNKLKNEFYNIEFEGVYFKIKEKHFEKQDKDLHLTFTINHQFVVEQKAPTLANIESQTEERKGQDVKEIRN